MSTTVDPLSEEGNPDRVAYATGVLLDAKDFKDEQTYHRGRLARALSYLHGSGTVSGLAVQWDKAQPGGREEMLHVGPGLAIDRLGRLIEVPREACLRLDRWYRAQPAGELVKAFHPAQPPIAKAGVVVDVFIRFVTCERGKTPAFATGPFDALDAAQPSRLRDGYRLDLVLRQETLSAGAPKLPQNAFPDVAGIADANVRRKTLQDAILASWRGGGDGSSGPLPPLSEHAALQDPTAVFLARLVLPANEGSPPTRTDDVLVDNESRRFVWPMAAVARWLAL